MRDGPNSSISVVLDSQPRIQREWGLRGFIEMLDTEGVLVRVRERVHWKLDIGRITRECGLPLLFEVIEDYPESYVFTNGLYDAGAIALSLGLGFNTTLSALVNEARARLRAPVPPEIIETRTLPTSYVDPGTVNLLSLPVPLWDKSEKGRYIGTWHINVSRDPETGERNLGVYRMQVMDALHATVNVSKGSHLFEHIAKAEREGRPLPMAVAIGVPEAVMIAAAAAYPRGGDEYELAGALLQRPVKLIRCGTVDLEVPSESEIIIEGLIQPHVRVVDGPFFDYSGKPDQNPDAFLFEATRLVHRRNPIFRGASVGRPGAEDHQLFAFLAQIGLLDFHGSRARHTVQNFFVRQRCFRAFQWTGRARSLLTMPGKKRK